jgi:hypothetical protein
MRVIEPPALLDIREKLRGANASISTVLEVVSALVPETVDAETPLEEREPVGQADR